MKIRVILEISLLNVRASISCPPCFEILACKMQKIKNKNPRGFAAQPGSTKFECCHADPFQLFIYLPLLLCMLSAMYLYPVFA